VRNVPFLTLGLYTKRDCVVFVHCNRDTVMMARGRAECNECNECDEQRVEEQDDCSSLVICGIVLFVILAAYVCTPHDLVPVQRYGAVGLVDDAVVLVGIFFLIAVVQSTATSAVVTVMLAIVVLVTLSGPKYAVAPY